MHDPATRLRPKPHNVIKGQFAKAGQIDWAVLCSIRGVSSILVFRNRQGVLPPKIEHQGIDDAFLEKGSEIYYYDQRKWLKLPGATDPFTSHRPRSRFGVYRRGAPREHSGAERTVARRAGFQAAYRREFPERRAWTATRSGRYRRAGGRSSERNRAYLHGPEQLDSITICKIVWNSLGVMWRLPSSSKSTL